MFKMLQIPDDFHRIAGGIKPASFSHKLTVSFQIERKMVDCGSQSQRSVSDRVTVVSVNSVS